MKDEVYRRGATPGGSQIIVTTTNDLPGTTITEYLGIVRGIVVRSTGIGQSFIGGFRQLAGGNIPEYVQVCEQARQDAYLLMMDHAKQIGAHAVLAMRYDATEFQGGTTEVLAYGTAVRLEI